MSTSERSSHAPVAALRNAESALPPTAERPGRRLLFVDNLRVALTVLVVLHHLAVTYSGLPIWYYVESPPEGSWSAGLLPLFILFNQSFFMGLFFLISGYFVPPSYDRKGARAFLRDRLVRLGIPLLIFFLLLGPASNLALYRVEIVGKGVDLPYWLFYLLTLGPGPLWFLEVLLSFSALYVVWRHLRPSHGDGAARGDSRAFPGVGTIIAFTLGLAVASYVVRFWVPIGWYVPFVGLPTLSHVAQYAAMFVVGALAYRNNWLVRVPDRAGHMGIGAAILATVTLFPLALTDWEALTGGLTWQAFAYALWESIVCVGLSLGLLVFFRNHLGGQGALRRFLSAHAYTVFIIHAPIITALAFLLRGVQLDPLLKFALAALIGVPLCFALAGLVRRLPRAERVL